MSEVKFGMTKKGLVTKKVRELRSTSRELWSGNAKRSREGRLEEYGKGEKEMGLGFGIEAVGDRRVVEERVVVKWF